MGMKATGTYASALEQKLISEAIHQKDIDIFKSKVKTGDVLKQHNIKIVIGKIFPHVVDTNHGYLSWLSLYQFDKGLIEIKDSYEYRSISNKDSLIKEKGRHIKA